MSMKINLVGNPTGLPKVFNAEDANKQTVMIFTVATDQNFKGKDGKYGVDYTQIKAFPRSDAHGSYIWDTIEKAIERKEKVALTASRQPNNYANAAGEMQYEDVNRLDQLNLTGSLNTVTAVGRLGSDAKFFKNESGEVAVITIATERDYIAQGKSQPDVDYVQAKLFMRSEKQAETMKKHLLKGVLVDVTGTVRSSNYTNAKGEKVYSEEIIIDHINPFLAAKPGKAAAPVAEAAPAVNEAPAANANPFIK